MKTLLTILFTLAVALCINTKAQTTADAVQRMTVSPSPTPQPTPQVVPSSMPMPAPELKPVALSMIQMQQLTIVQKDQAFAAEMMARARAEQRALVAEFRWQLGVNPADYESDLQPLDQQGTVYGFVPKPKPQSPEPPKEAKPEPKQDGKQ